MGDRLGIHSAVDTFCPTKLSVSIDLLNGLVSNQLSSFHIGQASVERLTLSDALVYGHITLNAPVLV